MHVTLYSTGCPQCRVLEKKLDKCGISYDVVSDEQAMLDKGFRSAPMLEVDGEAMTFVQANQWVSSLKGGA